MRKSDWFGILRLTVGGLAISMSGWTMVNKNSLSLLYGYQRNLKDGTNNKSPVFGSSSDNFAYGNGTDKHFRISVGGSKRAAFRQG
jgi:hypothetical protein